MIVGLAGWAGAGKDTAAKGLIALGYHHESFAKPLKAMLYALNPLVSCKLASWEGAPGTATERVRHLVDRDGWDVAKQLPEIRELLQRLGTECVRAHLGEDSWVEALDKRLDKLECNDQGELNAVITDPRFPNEGELLSWIWGGLQVWIEKPSMVAPVNSHASESTDLRATSHAILVNDSTVEELQNALVNIVTLFEDEPWSYAMQCTYKASTLGVQ